MIETPDEYEFDTDSEEEVTKPEQLKTKGDDEYKRRISKIATRFKRTYSIRKPLLDSPGHKKE